MCAKNIKPIVSIMTVLGAKKGKWHTGFSKMQTERLLNGYYVLRKLGFSRNSCIEFWSSETSQSLGRDGAFNLVSKSY